MFFSSLKNLFKKEQKAEDHDAAHKDTENEYLEKYAKGYLIINSQKVAVDFPVYHKLKLSKKCYKFNSKKRNVSNIVTHWDATLSSDHCHRILENKGISTHLSIDNDGMVVQFVDLNDTAWHAGPTKTDKDLLSKKGVKLPSSVSWNETSIGIDFSNAYYPKYNKWYKDEIGKERDIINSNCQNMKLQHLGYYPEQLASYEKLLSFLCSHFGIPVECPKETKWVKECSLGQFSGIMCHYHLTPNKIDCAGLDLVKITENIKRTNNGEK